MDAVPLSGRPPDPWPPPWRRWVAACTLGEFLGMLAAAGCAAFGSAVVGEPTSVASASVVVAFAVVGGVVEGLSVGELQFRVLRSWRPGLSRRQYVGGTVALAATFWFLGMLPSAVLSSSPGTAASEGSAGEPPLALVAALAALGGALGGLAFGLVQGRALRGHVRYPWRWIRPNVVGWSVAVAVITVGASSAPGSWPLPGLLVFAAGVGVVAGGAVGVVTGQALPSLDLPLPAWNRTVVGLLLSPAHRLISRGVTVLRFRGRRTGTTVTVPVQYVSTATGLVVWPAHPEQKRWWRSFADEREVLVRLQGHDVTGMGRLVRPGDAGHAEASDAYRARWPRAGLGEDAVLVEVRVTA